MAIYRGTGGAGDSTTDATVTEVTQQAVNAAASATAAGNSATAASGSASTATQQAGLATTAKNNAVTAQGLAEDARDAAAVSENNADDSADDAQKLAINAEDSQYTLSDGTTTGYSALHYAAKAEDSATAASDSEGSAQSSEDDANDFKVAAAASAQAALESENAAEAEALLALGYKNDAAQSESNASGSASLALGYKNDAESAKTAAETARDNAQTAYDNFDDRYLGAKASDPALDNDGEALVTGALYFDTVNDVMKVYDGSSWLAAYASLSGALIATNNLSDLTDASTALTNLGIDTSISLEHIDLDTNATVSHAEGRVFYDKVNKSVAVYNDVSDITLQVGQEFYYRVYNNTGSTIANGKPVYFSGNHSTNPTIGLANGHDPNAYNVQGLATHDIPDQTYGYVTAAGACSGFDTSGLTAGASVFLGLTPGALTSTPPSYPNYPMCIGTCTVSDATNGTIYINQQNHSVNSFRVVGNAHVGQDLIVSGDLTVTGTQTVASSENISIGGAIQYLNAGDTIGETNTTFTGSGLNDGVLVGHYNGTATNRGFYVRIKTASTPDTFEWSHASDFSTIEATDIAITGSPQDLDEGIQIDFGTTTGHTVGDTWSGTASPVNVDTGWFSNRNTGTSGTGYTHLGMFFDVSDQKFRLISEYDPEPEGSIDTGDASYVTGTLIANIDGYATTSYVDTEIANIDALPDQTSNAGKFLTTDGSTASWAQVSGALPGEIRAISSNLTGAYSIPTSGTVDSDGWMYCDGSAIPSGNTVSGTLPDLTDSRFLRGSTSAGGTGGVSSVTLAVENLPSHSHTINHGHTGSTNDAGSHSHSGSANSAGNHRHSEVYWRSSGANTTLRRPGVNTDNQNPWTGYSDYAGTHSHSLTINSGGSHSHTVTVNSHSGSSGNTGSGTSFSVVPTYLNVQYLMQVK